MRKSSLLLSFLFVTLASVASELKVAAPEYVGEKAILFAYEDYFSMREKVLGTGLVNDSGQLVLQISTSEIELVKLRIDHVVADFFIEPDKDYSIQFNRPEKGVARTLNGSTKVSPLFLELDAFDINALLTDLNLKLDAFTVQEYQKEKAIDQKAAKEEQLKAIKQVDSSSVVRSTFPARLDTFETKLKNYYSEVEHAAFKEQMEYALAQMRITKEHSRKLLFERYLADRPINYRSTEYVKFIKRFFKGFLMQDVYSGNPDIVKETVDKGDVESLRAYFAQSDLLRNEELRELIMMHELFSNSGREEFDRSKIMEMLKLAKFEEVNSISRSMLAKLSQMSAGTPFPKDIELWSPLDASSYSSDTLSKGYTFVAISASWCSYCHRETQAFTSFAEEYGEHVNFVVLSIDKDVDDFRDSPELQPSGSSSFYIGDDALLLKKLNVTTIPAFYLLEDGKLVKSPANSPGQGVARQFHKIKVAANEGRKIKVWDD